MMLVVDRIQFVTQHDLRSSVSRRQIDVHVDRANRPLRSLRCDRRGAYRQRDDDNKHARRDPPGPKRPFEPQAHASAMTRSALPPITLAISSSEYPAFTSHRTMLIDPSVGFSSPSTYSTSSKC